jgi:F-type H+-transporting ATPase subunit b
MQEILREVGQAFVQAIPTVIFVGLLVLILQRLFFRPLTGVLEAREDATKGARERARQRAALAEAEGQEYEAAWQKARQEVYRQRDADRRAALAGRETVLQQARARAESLVQEAQVALGSEAQAARAELGLASRTLAEEVAQAVLGGPEPGGREGGFSG